MKYDKKNINHYVLLSELPFKNKDCSQRIECQEKQYMRPVRKIVKCGSKIMNLIQLIKIYFQR